MAGIDSGLIMTATATHATSAVATLTGVANTKIRITEISGSSDLVTATILVKDGTTVIWQDLVKSTVAYIKNFVIPLAVTVGANASVTVNGTAVCYANISGYQL